MNGYRVTHCRERLGFNYDIFVLGSDLMKIELQMDDFFKIASLVLFMKRYNAYRKHNLFDSFNKKNANALFKINNEVKVIIENSNMFILKNNERFVLEKQERNKIINRLVETRRYVYNAKSKFRYDNVDPLEHKLDLFSEGIVYIIKPDDMVIVAAPYADVNGCIHKHIIKLSKNELYKMITFFKNYKKSKGFPGVFNKFKCEVKKYGS